MTFAQPVLYDVFIEQYNKRIKGVCESDRMSYEQLLHLATKLVFDTSNIHEARLQRYRTALKTYIESHQNETDDLNKLITLAVIDAVKKYWRGGGYRCI